MNNLSDFANFGEFKKKFEGSGGGRRWGGGRQTEVCAPGAKNPRYASVCFLSYFECMRLRKAKNLIVIM